MDLKNCFFVEIHFDDLNNIYSEYEATNGYNISIDTKIFKSANLDIYIYTPKCKVCREYWIIGDSYIVDINGGYIGSRQLKKWKSKKSQERFYKMWYR